MKSNSTFLKFGSSTIVQTHLTGTLTWSISGLGTITPGIDRVAKFTAPNVIDSGRTEITCSNDSGESDKITISYGSHLHIVGAILRDQLGLQSDQTILAWEDYRIPSDNKTRIYLGSQNPRPYANLIEGSDEVVQSVSVIDSISIEVYGKSQSVGLSSIRAIAALNSRFSEKKCEENSMKILNLPTNLSNVSAAEGSSGLKRFVGTFNIFYNLIIEKEGEYFDKFAPIQFLEEP